MRIIIWMAFLCCQLAGIAQVSNCSHPLKLKVATYNVGHFNQGDAGGLEISDDVNKNTKDKVTELEMLKWRDWVGNESLDMLGVQEWNRYFDRDSTFHSETEILEPFYINTYFGDEHTWIYNGIATNYHLSNIRQKYWFGDYYALIGDLKTGDITVTVISTHIPWQKEWHLPALDSIISELKKYEYFICMGDINAKDEEQLRFQEEGFNIANGGYLGWFPTSGGTIKLQRTKDGPDRHIDNIITSRNIKIMNISAPFTGLNDYDHLPLIADLIITKE